MRSAPTSVRSTSACRISAPAAASAIRSEEHTSELQSQSNLVCRLLLEKKKSAITITSEEHTSQLQSQSHLVWRHMLVSNGRRIVLSFVVRQLGIKHS